MKISLKTSSSLAKYLPAGSVGNKAELEVEEGATPQGVMRQLGLPEGATYLVVLNGENVPKADQVARQLADNDALAIMPPLKGG
ncbi:MAG: MoaD/ThiS family protein [Pseudomonadota bacterium]